MQTVHLNKKNKYFLINVVYQLYEPVVKTESRHWKTFQIRNMYNQSESYGNIPQF